MASPSSPNKGLSRAVTPRPGRAEAPALTPSKTPYTSVRAFSIDVFSQITNCRERESFVNSLCLLPSHQLQILQAKTSYLDPLFQNGHHQQGDLHLGQEQQAGMLQSEEVLRRLRILFVPSSKEGPRCWQWKELEGAAEGSRERLHETHYEV